MALVFSPVTADVLDGPFQPRPGCAFLMLHSGERRSRLDRDLERSVCDGLHAVGLSPLRATDVRNVGDYLEKIIGLIRGCGIGVAIFSEATPAPTLANIFFEVGLCLMFGRPVVLAKTAEAVTPSDFVRTEWVAQYEDADQFVADLSATFRTLTTETAEYFRKLGEVALEADEVDYEAAFERYVQAILIGGQSADVARVREIHDALRKPTRDPRLLVARRRLSASVSGFLKLLPDGLT